MMTTDSITMSAVSGRKKLDSIPQAKESIEMPIALTVDLDLFM